MLSEEAILSRLSPASRQRIEAESERFAPLIALMCAWKESVDEHLSQVEDIVLDRLLQQLFPTGEWRFPAQTLAIPDDLARREVSADTIFIDRDTGTPWTSCGEGMLLPSKMERCGIERGGFNNFALVCTVQYRGHQPDERLIMPPAPPEDPEGQGQLAYVNGSEKVAAALANARWAIQFPGEGFQPLGAERYEGYLEFEKALGMARLRQKQLQSWIPPFYPYSRKFLNFFLPSPIRNGSETEWEWLGEQKDACRIAALLDRETAVSIQQEGQEGNLLILNAVPVSQMRMISTPLLLDPQKTGDSCKVPFLGVQNAFAAGAFEIRSAGRMETFFHPVSFVVRSSQTALTDGDRQDIEVVCDRPESAMQDYQIRLYYDSFGESAPSPVQLSRPNGQQFKAPLPAVGSMNGSIHKESDEGTRRLWFQTMLQSPQLTLGDVLETLASVPECRKNFDLSPDMLLISLDIDRKPAINPTCWNSWLWPSLTADATLDIRSAAFTASRVPLKPVMQLMFAMKQTGLPAYLQQDLAAYAASILSQYMMLGWYRTEGKVRN